MGRHIASGDHMDSAVITHGVGGGDFTIAGWIKLASLPGVEAGIWSNTAGFVPEFYINAASKLAVFWLGDINTSFNTALTAGVWVHVAMRRQSGVMRAFVSGVIEPSSGASTASLSNSSQRIGKAGGVNITMDAANWAFWGSALSNTQIAHLAAGYHPDVVGAPHNVWPLAGIASPEPDIINGNDLVLTGTSASADDPPSFPPTTFAPTTPAPTTTVTSTPMPSMVGTFASAQVTAGDDMRVKVIFDRPGGVSTWGAPFTQHLLKAPTLDVTSPGYTGTTLGTVNRTVKCTYISSSVVGTQLVTYWRPRTPVYANDTLHSISMVAGAVTDNSGHSTGSVVAQSITNNGTWTGETVITRIAGVLSGSTMLMNRHVLDANFIVEVAAFHVLGVAAVKIAVTDGTTTRTTTVTSMTHSTYRDSAVISSGRFTDNGGGLGVYQASFTAADFLDTDLTITVTTYPIVGTATEKGSASWVVFNNHGSGLTTVTKHCDAALGSNLNDGSFATPYQTLARAIQDANGVTTRTQFIVKCKAGTYTVDASGVTTDNGVVLVVMPDTAVPALDVIIRGNGNVRIRRLGFLDCAIDLSNGIGGWEGFSAQPGVVDSFITFQGCQFFHPGGLGSGNPWVPSVYSQQWIDYNFSSGAWFLECVSSNFNANAFARPTFMRNCASSNTGGDILDNSVFVMGCELDGLVNTSDDSHDEHNDSMQWFVVTLYAPDPPPVWNGIVYCCKLLNSVGQGFFSDQSITGLAIVNCLYVSSEVGAAAGQFGKISITYTIRHFLFWHNTVINQAMFGVGALSGTRSSTVENSVVKYYVSDPECALGFGDGHAESNSQNNSTLHGWSSGAGGLFEDGTDFSQIYNALHADFHPVPLSPLRRLPSADVRIPFDIEGNHRPTDGTAAVGAFELASPLPTTLSPTTPGPTTIATTSAPTTPGPTTHTPTTTEPILTFTIMCARSCASARREIVVRAWLEIVEGRAMSDSLLSKANSSVSLYSEAGLVASVQAEFDDPIGSHVLQFRIPNVDLWPGHAYFLRVSIIGEDDVVYGISDFPMGTT